MKCILGSLLMIPVLVGCGDTEKTVWIADTGTRTNTGDEASSPGDDSDSGGGSVPEQDDSGVEPPFDTATPQGEDSGAITGVDTAESDTGRPAEGSDADSGDSGSATDEDTGAPDTGIDDAVGEEPPAPVVPVFNYELVYHPPDFVYAEPSRMDTIYPTPVDWDGDGDRDLVIFNDWTADASVSYHTAPRTFAAPVPIANPVDHAIDTLTAHHDDEFTSTNVSVVRTTPIQVNLDGSEGVLVQMQVARGSSWTAPGYNPVVLLTADGNTLLSTEPTSGARVLHDLNGDGLPEVLLGYLDGGADILWNADPDIRTPVPLDVLIVMKLGFGAAVAVTNPETGEFLLYPGGTALPSRHTLYRMQADEMSVTIVETIDIGYIPTLVVSNHNEPAPQSLFVVHYANPVMRFREGAGVAVSSDVEPEGITGHTTRYAQLDGVAGYELMEMNSYHSRWLMWMDRPEAPMKQTPLTYTERTPGDGEYSDDMYIRDLDGDDRADIIKCHVGEENYYQRIWWNDTE